MHLIYNSVEIGIMTLHEFVGEPVYADDGVTYLYTRYRIYCTGVVNGQVEVQENYHPTSYKTSTTYRGRALSAIDSSPPGTPLPPAGVLGPLPVNDTTQPLGVQQKRSGPADIPIDPFTDTAPSGVYAPPDVKMLALVKSPVHVNVTDRAIRHRLQTPRGMLILYTGAGNPAADEVLLMSPKSFTHHTDAKMGPIPTLYGVTQAMGDGVTYYVDFAVETYIFEGAENGVNPGPLLANRFTSRHDIDTDGFCVILVEGTAVFNAEYVYRAGGKSPDDFRRSLFLPVPFGFMRGNITVEGTPDGNGIRYAFTDRQMPVHLPAAPYANATQVECVHRQIINTDTDILGGALQAYERGLGILVNTKWANQGEPDYPTDTPQKKKKKKKGKNKPPSP